MPQMVSDDLTGQLANALQRHGVELPDDADADDLVQEAIDLLRLLESEGGEAARTAIAPGVKIMADVARTQRVTTPSLNVRKEPRQVSLDEQLADLDRAVKAEKVPDGVGIHGVAIGTTRNKKRKAS